jgi:hypothetical protein
VSNIL